MIAWAITSDEHGLYTGTAPTRVAAIAQHVWAYERELFDQGWPHIQTHALTPLQRSVWNQRRAKGDRAVRVKIEHI